MRGHRCTYTIEASCIYVCRGNTSPRLSRTKHQPDPSSDIVAMFPRVVLYEVAMGWGQVNPSSSKSSFRSDNGYGTLSCPSVLAAKSMASIDTPASICFLSPRIPIYNSHLASSSCWGAVGGSAKANKLGGLSCGTREDRVGSHSIEGGERETIATR